MTNVGFREALERKQENINSLVCVGLDPLPEKIPALIRKMDKLLYQMIVFWMCEIVDATALYASAFKLQRAYYEAIPNGEIALRTIISHIKAKYPQTPIILDCKRGDIGRTQERYREAHFGIDFGANAISGMNFNPYMGKSCMASLVDNKFPGRAIVGLGRTSNPDAWEVQDVRMWDERRYWEYVTERTMVWAEELGIIENAGIVMGAAHKASLLNGHIHYPETNYGEDEVYSWHLKVARSITGDRLWFLIPGIGTQQGFVKQTVKASYKGPGSITINSSSKIIFASPEDDFAEASAHEAKKLRDEINQYR